jgi:hypothetical protein
MMQHKAIGELDAYSIVQIAIRAQVDPRTVRKRLSGKEIRGLAGARIDRVLAELGPHGDARSPRSRP